MTSVAQGNLINYRALRTYSCITDWSIKFWGMCTLPHDISSSFKTIMTDLLTGSVQTYTIQYLSRDCPP